MRSHEEYVSLHSQMNEQAIESANHFLKTMILVNGGSAIAVLSFVASLASKDESFTTMLPEVADALMNFAWGVVAGVTSMALAYLTIYATNVALNHEEGSWASQTRLMKRAVHVVAAFSGMATIYFFIIGAAAVRNAIVAGIL